MSDQEFTLDGERAFTFTVAAGLLPGLAALLSGGLARRFWATPRWGPRIAVVAIFDGLLLLAVIGALISTGGRVEPPPTKVSLKIGVSVGDGGEGVSILRVRPGGPADEAGLGPGDVVTHLDGEPVSRPAPFIDFFRRLDTPRPVELRRKGGETLVVTPVERLPPLPRDYVPPALPAPSCVEAAYPQGGREWLRFVAGGLFIALVWLAAAVRAPARPPWFWIALPLTLAPLVGAAAVHGGCSRFGLTPTVTLVGVVVQSGALVVGSFVVYCALRSRLSSLVVGPKLAPGTAYLRGVVFFAGTFARLAVVLGVAVALHPELDLRPGATLETLFSSARGPWGRGLLILGAAIFAPIGEELAFRGVVMGGLLRRMGPTTALWLSAGIFGLFHVPSHGAAAVMPAILGVIFGWARLRTGGLAVPMALHASNNLLVALMN